MKGKFIGDAIEDFTAKILSGREAFVGFDEGKI